MKVIGILGGGQLGQMLGLAAIPLGLRCIFYEQADNPCAAAAGKVYRNLTKFAEAADVFTYEFENIPQHITTHPLIKNKLLPPLKPLRIAADRSQEKTLFAKLGIPTVNWLPLPATMPGTPNIPSVEDLADAAQTIGLPMIVKTTTMGYDGKGQVVVRTQKDLAKAARDLKSIAKEHRPVNVLPAKTLPKTKATAPSSPFIVEQMVNFKRELSIISARDRQGNIAHYPIAENHHQNGILYSTDAPALISVTRLRQLHSWMEKLLTHLSYTGILTLEVFETSKGLLANEMAPRVHNSGHWTIEGTISSQFENHIRAVAGMKLGSTQARGYSKMFNLVGRAEPRLAQITDAHLHLYGKQARRGRKLGHLTYTAASKAQLHKISSSMEPHKSFYS